MDSGLDQFEFYLAEGTGLALQIGHRISEDLEFFSPRDFESGVVSRLLATKGAFEESLVSPGTLYDFLHGVKL